MKRDGGQPAAADHERTTVSAVTLAVTPVGAPRLWHETAPATITRISLDGPLVPALLAARMRTKYEPGGTFTTTSDVAAPPVSKLAISVEPTDDPA